MCESNVATKIKPTIMDKTTLLEKVIRIPNPKRFMWIHTKQNYNRHVERMENWKDISEEKDWGFKAGLVPLFLMSWEALMLNVMLEFLNTFVIKGTNIYFGQKDKVYVINKELIVDVFGICIEGYVKDPKG